MSKFICCDICGTIYDSEKCDCPICSKEDAAPKADPDSRAAAPTLDMDADIERFVGSLFSGIALPTLEDDPEELQIPDLTPSFDFHDSESEANGQDIPPAPDTPSEAPEESIDLDRTMMFKMSDLADPPTAKAAPAAKKKDRPSKTVPIQEKEDGPVPAFIPVSEPSEESKDDLSGDTAATMAAARPIAKGTVPDPDEGEAAEAPRRRRENSDSHKRKKKGTITTRDKIICLVLGTLVVLLALFMFYRFLRPHLGGEETQPTEETQAQTEQTEADLHCTSVLIDKELTLTEAGESITLSVTLEPANTTDTLIFSTDNPEVATVTDEGVVTAVGAGEANITVTCGSVTAVCTVKCDLPPEETEPPTEATEPPTEATEPEPTQTDPPTFEPTELELNRTDATLFKKGETFRLKAGDYTAIVTWRSSNPAVAKVDNSGRVTAVGPGTARIYASYGDLEVYCIVRCNFESETEPSEATEPTNITEPTEATEPTEVTEPTDATEPDPTEASDPEPTEAPEPTEPEPTEASEPGE